MTDQARAPIFESLPGKRAHKRGQFRVDRLLDQLARSIAQDARERVGCKTRWIGQFGDGSL